MEKYMQELYELAGKIAQEGNRDDRYYKLYDELSKALSKASELGLIQEEE